MTAITFQHTAGAKTSIALACGFLTKVVTMRVADASRWWELRGAVRRLGTAPDAILRDIGIARSGIESAVRYGRQRSSKR
jgi:uncharacterized protein YjiS (DUF1127 family)